MVRSTPTSPRLTRCYDVQVSCLKSNPAPPSNQTTWKLTSKLVCEHPPRVLLDCTTGRTVLARCRKCAPCRELETCAFIARCRSMRATHFVTLTQPSDAGEPTALNFKSANRGWRKLRNWWRRSHPARGEHYSQKWRRWVDCVGVPALTQSDYVWVNELASRLHKHVICCLPTRFCFWCVREKIVQCGLGQVADWRPIKKAVGNSPVRLARYVSKTLGAYMSKSFDGSVLPRYSRRKQTNIKRAPFEKTGHWHAFRTDYLSDRSLSLVLLARGLAKFTSLHRRCPSPARLVRLKPMRILSPWSRSQPTRVW